MSIHLNAPPVCAVTEVVIKETTEAFTVMTKEEMYRGSTNVAALALMRADISGIRTDFNNQQGLWEMLCAYILNGSKPLSIFLISADFPKVATLQPMQIQ
jgi:hypothetical protein